MSVVSSDSSDLNARLSKLVKAAAVMLFMKGTPAEPRCKFSRKMVGLLKGEGIQFGYFDILTDDDVRQGLKAYSNWPTFPQLYINGELVGGMDIVQELHDEGELKSKIPKGSTREELNDRLGRLVKKEKVMLFMKGDPEAPQCGFSRKTVSILSEYPDIKYGHFNILEDNEVRQGLKAYSNWPTFPQLYVNGTLIGGLDIIAELHADGELADSLE